MRARSRGHGQSESDPDQRVRKIHGTDAGGARCDRRARILRRIPDQDGSPGDRRGPDHRRERQQGAQCLAGQERPAADAHRQERPQRALITLAGKARERERNHQQRQQDERGGRRRQLSETPRRRGVLDRPMPCQLLLVGFEKHEHAYKRIEARVDRRERLDRLEHESAVMRGGVRVHVALVEPHVPLRLLRIGVLPRDLRLIVNAAGDGGDKKNEKQTGRPAEPAVTPDFGGVLGRKGQRHPAFASLRRGRLAAAGHCFAVVVVAEY